MSPTTLTPTLASTRLILRSVALDDAPAMQQHFANWEIIKDIGGIPWPYPKNGSLDYIERRLKDSTQQELYFWGIFWHQEPRALIGVIEYKFAKDDPENRGFWIAQDYWGQGLMTEAVGVTQDYVFDVLQKPRLCVTTRSTNLASKAVKDKTGAYKIGVNTGQYQDGEQPQDIWEITPHSWAAAKSKLKQR
ncbi:GNAT family N-acetyltransferase [Algirhabdus cladophorae]|uniref:GNAT family N-acetyltransferase n=1 Tax=Algirhabdus cladophorae TaxID=3377108 RepID=UPI003B84895B